MKPLLRVTNKRTDKLLGDHRFRNPIGDTNDEKALNFFLIWWKKWKLYAFLKSTSLVHSKKNLPAIIFCQIGQKNGKLRSISASLSIKTICALKMCDKEDCGGVAHGLGQG